MTRSRCHICFSTFNVQRYEMKYLGNTDPRNAKYQAPVTYVDWQAHVMLTCPVCRLQRMPATCVVDLERIIALEYSKKDPLDSEDVIE